MYLNKHLFICIYFYICKYRHFYLYTQMFFNIYIHICFYILIFSYTNIFNCSFFYLFIYLYRNNAENSKALQRQNKEKKRTNLQAK